MKSLKNHIKRKPVAVKNIDHLFCGAIEFLDSDELHLFLLLDGARIDNT